MRPVLDSLYDIQGTAMKKILAMLFCLFALGARADEFDDVKSYAERMINATLTEIFVKDSTHEERIKSFRRALAENFDFNHIGKFVLGVYGRGLDEAGLGKFTASFSELNVYSYVKKFKSYDNQKVYVISASAAKKDGEFFVDTKALAAEAQQKDTSIVWRVARAGKSYKVIDVIIEGVSMAMSYKNEYAPMLKAAQDEGKNPVGELILKIDEKSAALKAEK